MAKSVKVGIKLLDPPLRISIYDLWHVSSFVFPLDIIPVSLLKQSEVQEASLKMPAVDSCSANKLESRGCRIPSLRLLQISRL